VRAGIRALLDSLPDVAVIAEAGNGREALRLIDQERPDVVLMDVAMKSMNGVEATLRISRDFPEVRVIILSMHANEEYVIESLRAGARGYMLKDAAVDELALAIKTVAEGHTYLSPVISNYVVHYLQRVGSKGQPVGSEGQPGGSEGQPVGSKGQRDPATASPYEILTPRQREILQLIAEGATTQTIAETLQVSVKTVETHRAQLMERLQIHDIPALVRYALRTGLINPET
jgi:DNA-binding NarL/FixJ family response regulator